ncbi:MAG: hypothetical protein J6X27_05260 [Bacteroidaceae bacterium]|nr:hypothetical protein [Bacteroidaceae bacterium]MBP5629236.1 hypothetical protein [Bacteroidaceae bacterium]
MLRTYKQPSISLVRMSPTALLMLSGGGKGTAGDHADSRKFWGDLSPWEEEDNDETDE